MIVLFSFDGDKNTNQIIDWLIYFECPFKRIDLGKENINNLQVQFVNGKVEFLLKCMNDEIIDFSCCSFVFNRGNGFEKMFAENEIDLPDHIFENFISNEFNSITEFFYSYINKKSLGCFIDNSVNKLNQLNTAIDVGFEIPPTIITNNFSTLIKNKSNKMLINKAIQDNLAYREYDRLYYQYTKRVDLEQLEEEFYLSLFQDEIPKKFEVRTFYLDGKTFSIKFHSDSLNVDMRENYSIQDYSPFRLPMNIDKKVDSFMKKMNLKYGSIDFIYSENDKYFFLEVNPNGQYDWVSYMGGYNLHFEIANYLNKKVKR